jgi:D-3-phosphoglycerate dehydrogenase
VVIDPTRDGPLGLEEGMIMFKVLATSQSFCRYSADREPGEKIRSAGIALDLNNKGEKYTVDDFLSVIDQYDGVIVGADPITEQVIERGPRLKILAKAGVGYDNIDVGAATKRGVFVTITPGAVEDAVADGTLALMLAVARNVAFGDAALRRGDWDRRIGFDICGKRLGIVGLGGIGKQVARRAKCFRMDIFATDPELDQEFCQKHGISALSLDEVFKECDIISIHVPLNEKTRKLVDDEKLSMMKENAILINTSRGGVIDQRALCEALKEKQIAGAGLDVYEQEPPDAEDPLFDQQNAVFTPHTSGYSTDCLLRIGTMVAESVIAVSEGKVPPNSLNADGVV